MIAHEERFALLLELYILRGWYTLSRPALILRTYVGRLIIELVYDKTYRIAILGVILSLDNISGSSASYV